MSICLVASAYVVGGIPSTFVLARCLGRMDVRYSGIWNISVTNVLRTAEVSVALAVLVLDLGKRYVVVFVARILDAGQVI
jgi:glycerol-3-phosphate acyltransferase PlsY